MDVMNSNVFSKYTATLFVPDGTIGSEDIAGTYKGENGWKKFSKIIEGYLVDVPALDGLTYNCLINGEGSTLTRTATMIGAAKLIDVTIPDTIKIEKDSAYKNKKQTDVKNSLVRKVQRFFCSAQLGQLKRL